MGHTFGLCRVIHGEYFRTAERSHEICALPSRAFSHNMQAPQVSRQVVAKWLKAEDTGVARRSRRARRTSLSLSLRAQIVHVTCASDARNTARLPMRRSACSQTRLARCSSHTRARCRSRPVKKYLHTCACAPREQIRVDARGDGGAPGGGGGCTSA